MPQLISSTAMDSDDQLVTIETYLGSVSLCSYARGFLELAQLSVRAGLESRTAVDAITPSILYTTRHAVELFLKHVVGEVLEIRDEHEMPFVQRTLTHHKLKDIWREHSASVVELLEHEASHSEHNEFDWRKWAGEFEEVIGEVDRIDPNGQSLRYPATTKGSPNLGGVVVVSLRSLEQFVQRAHQLLEQFAHRKT